LSKSLEEAHNAEVRTAARLSGICATSRIAYVEFLSALAKREREGLDVKVAQGIRVTFETKWPDLMVVDVSRTMTIRASGLARAHALRAYDAVHLACAQEIQETAPDLVFACFDDRWNQAALGQGMRTL
jgi:predicted nucleic acid-binding protein